MGRQKNDGRGRLGGREKGTPNKEENPIKKYLRAHSEKFFEPDPTDPEGKSKFEQHLDNLSSDDLVAIEVKILEYHTPKMKSMDVALEAGQRTLTIEARLRQLSGEED